MQHQGREWDGWNWETLIVDTWVAPQQTLSVSVTLKAGIGMKPVSHHQGKCAVLSLIQLEDSFEADITSLRS